MTPKWHQNGPKMSTLTTIDPICKPLRDRSAVKMWRDTQIRGQPISAPLEGVRAISHPLGDQILLALRECTKFIRTRGRWIHIGDPRKKYTPLNRPRKKVYPHHMRQVSFLLIIKKSKTTIYILCPFISDLNTFLAFYNSFEGIFYPGHSASQREFHSEKVYPLNRLRKKYTP